MDAVAKSKMGVPESECHYYASTGNVTKATVDGDVVWATELHVRFATPHVVVTKTGDVYATARRRVFRLDAVTGEVVESVKMTAASRIHNVCAHLHVLDGAGGLVYVCGKAVARLRTDVSLEDEAAVVWQTAVKKISGPSGTSVVDEANGVVVVSVSGSVYAVALSDGAVVDANRFRGQLHSSFTLALDGDGALVAGDRGNLYLQPVDGSAARRANDSDGSSSDGSESDGPEDDEKAVLEASASETAASEAESGSEAGSEAGSETETESEGGAMRGKKIKLGAMATAAVGVLYSASTESLICASSGQVTAHAMSAPYDVKWKNKLKGLKYGTGLSVAEACKAGLVFVGISGKVAALDSLTGETVWTAKVSKLAPLVSLFVDEAAERVYAGALGTVTALAIATGEVVHTVDVGSVWGYVTFAGSCGSTDYNATPIAASFEKHRRRQGGGGAATSSSR